MRYASYKQKNIPCFYQMVQVFIFYSANYNHDQLKNLKGKEVFLFSNTVNKNDDRKETRVLAFLLFLNCCLRDKINFSFVSLRNIYLRCKLQRKTNAAAYFNGI